MSEIDLSNSKVLKNFLLGQMREGKGEFSYKEKVLVFRDKTGNEFICPPEMVSEVHVESKETGETLIPSNEEVPVEPALEGAGLEKKKKKKILV